ncbi:MAG: glycosyltransferase [bacterium]
MHILQLYSGQNLSTGDFVYRIERPAKGLSALPGVTVKNIDLLELPHYDELCEWPLLILHHITDADLLPVLAARKAKGLKTVYELADHFLASQEHRTEMRSQGPPDYYWVMTELMRRCDAVQTTGSALKQRYQHLNSNFLIFPNFIDRVRVRKEDTSSGGTMTIGWGGSLRHAADLQHYAEPLLNWIRAHPDTRLAIMAAPKIRKLFKALPPEQVRLRQPGSLQDYVRFLDELDVGIAPLLPTEFNAGRSDVKYLELASREVVPVCSRFGPYSTLGTEGENILLFDHAAELIDHLEALRTQPAQRRKIARAARQWIEQTRLARTEQWQNRAETYQKWTDGSSGVFRPSHETRDKNRKHVAQLLNQALTISDPAKSLSLIKTAARFAPGHYQAQYFLGWALSKAGRYPESAQELRRALALCPISVRTVQLLTRVLFLMNDLDGAMTVIEHGLRIEPLFPTLLTLKGIALQLKNRHREALEVLEACIELDPCIVEAELAYFRSARVLGLQSEIEAAAYRLRDLIPDAPEVTVISAGSSSLDENENHESKTGMSISSHHNI